MYHKWQSYDAWFLRYEVWQTEFFNILDYFLLFHCPNNPENQNFEKMRTTSRNIIILHKWVKNVNHMMYSCWDMKCNRQNYLSFWVSLCPFTPTINPKNQNIYKNENKTPGDVIILHKSAKIMIIWHLTDVIVILILGYFLTFYLHNSPKNLNFYKIKKVLWEIIILHKCTKNHDHMLYCSWDMACDGCYCYFSFWAMFGLCLALSKIL